MDELQRTKMELSSVKQELRVLRETHEITILELAEAKENQAKYKKLNDALIEGIEANKATVTPLPDITLKIEGQFGCNRCIDLQKELESYRTGVNFSVQRRVKEIAKNFSEFQQEDRKKSRIACSKITNHVNYNLSTKQCENCRQIQKELQLQHQEIQKIVQECEQKLADKEILQAKISKMEALIHNLQEQIEFLDNQVAKYKHLYEQSQKQQSWDYYNTLNQRKSRASIGRQTDQKSNKMMQEITNIVSCLSNKKFQDDKRKSRAFQTNDNSLFTIKNAINRPTGDYF